jgi:periplasmic divalent cation tolerance protein
MGSLRCSSTPSIWTAWIADSLRPPSCPTPGTAELKAVPEKPVLILVTTGARDDAERLGEALVEAHLAACCSVVPTVHSIYFWEGQLQREHEALLLIKTLDSRADEVQEYVRSHHDYKNPEIIRLPIDGGSATYLDWIATEVRRGA